MNKTAIKNFAIWARNKLIADVCYRARLVGITEQGIQTALPQSDATTEFYDIGTATPYAISGRAALQQRRHLAEAIRSKTTDLDYAAAYQYIMEEVAYTWFNRLIAVRFMEVNDYLPGRVRVLSSESGKVEPDLVTTPFDADLNFTAEEEKAILQMKHDNQLDELFRLLFIKQCNTLAAVLPALFEQHDDYTELLLNLSVVDQDGVVWRLTHDIPEDDFNVEKGGQVEIIGWLYQYYNTEPKAQVFARPSGQKIKKEEIPAATQLFTPDWIVRYMVENSLGRLWLEGHPDKELRAGWKYYLDEAEQEPDVAAQLEELRAERRSLTPEDIKVIDPCMGSGHILVYAFDVLMQIYEKAGWERREAARSIVEKNLYGLDIDKRAYQLAYFAVMMKARQYDRRFLTREIEPQVYYPGEDKELEEFGSLLTVEKWDKPGSDQISLHDTANHYRRLLAEKYDVVVTNPPYMAVSNASGKMQEYIKKSFPDSKADLFAVFIERCGQFVGKNGYQAMITQHAWMFLSSFEKLRAKLQAVDTVNMAHLGARAFEEIGGEVVQTTSFVMRKSHVKSYKGTYCRLIEPTTQRGKEDMLLARENHYVAQQDNFSKIPGAPVAYWVSNHTFDLFSKEKVGDFFRARVGLMTTDNDLFLRFFWEVDYRNIFFSAHDDNEALLSRKKWFPHNKGGSFRKWAGNREYVVDWENRGQRIKKSAVQKYPYLKGNPNFVVHDDGYYFHENVSWSEITSGRLAFRYFPCGFTFNVKGMSAFCNSNHSLFWLLGFANSTVVNYFSRIINPSLSFGVNSFNAIPFIETSKQVEKLSIENIQISTADWDSFETSWDFTRHPLVRRASTVAEAFAAWESECNARFTQLKAHEEELNRIFIDIYGLQDELTPEVEDKDVTVRRADRERDVKSLISYLIGVVMGRYSLDIPGLAYAGGEWDASKYQTYHPDEDGIIPIYRGIGMEDGLTAQIIGLLKFIYGEDTYRQNIDFIAESIGHNNNESSEEALNRYLNDGFFADHLKIYQKRPIYWFFSSGKNSGFKCLVYMHRYTRDTLARINSRYFLPESTRLKNELEELAGRLAKAEGRDRVRLEKERQKLAASYNEAIEYGQVLDHMANQYIEIDLDDGVKVNYAKFQGVEMVTDSGNKVRKDLLAPIK